ncbi:MAG: sigma-70 family RNA polymerase sigma factor [Planctomycetes bacterium]|nr:sigma-70 family RNA polymerase sigma factor [Planctomycetota bacterium]
MDKNEDFKRLLLEQLDRLYFNALRLAGGRSADAEDLVQECAIRAWKNAGAFMQGTNFRAWLYKIMLNVHLDLCRKKNIRNEIGGINEEITEVPVKNSEDFSAHEEIERLRELLPEELARALDALSDEHRLIVLLADVDGFSYKEISEITNKPIGTVMSRLFYAREALRKSVRP